MNPSLSEDILRSKLASSGFLRKISAATAALQQSSDLIDSFFDEDEAADGRSLPRPGKSNCNGRKDYNDSVWGRMLIDESDKLMDCDSAEAKLFRRRFRVPYKLYLIILRWTEEWVAGKEKSTDCTGRSAVPTSLKLLGVLRILGRGTCFDGIKELTYMGETTMWKFFHEFCEWFRKVIYPKFVKPPRTNSEIEKAMGPYAALGLMGAIGSTDAVHIHWGCCPSELRTLHTGKEGFPTLVYNVTGIVFHDIIFIFG